VKYFRFVIWIALIAFAASCAKISDPLPPRVGAPEKVQGVDVKQTGYSVVLSWTNPRAYVDGSPMDELAALHVFQNGSARRPVPSEGPGARQSITIPANDALGSKQTFFIIAETRKGRMSDPSINVDITPEDVPGPVTNLRGTVDQNRITLSWDPPADKRDLVNGYLVHRSDGGADAVISDGKTTFDDRSYEKGKTYTYTVTPIRLNKASAAIPGPSGETRSVEAVDTTKPAKPQTVPVIDLGPAGALINWTPNTEDDIKGYRVYTATSKEGPFTRIGDNLQRPQFPDPNYRPGIIYGVTAVDQSDNESEMAFPTFAQ
jgi:hypothetical protein